MSWHHRLSYELWGQFIIPAHGIYWGNGMHSYSEVLIPKIVKYGICDYLIR